MKKTNNIHYFNNLELIDIEGEIWMDIDGYEKYYQVSSFGRVKALDRIIPRQVVLNGIKYKNDMPVKAKIKAQKIGNTGRLYVFLYKEHKFKNFQVSRLVCSAFNGKPVKGQEANHIDGDCLNNKSNNLEWVTRRQNYDHAKENGLMPRGEKHVFNKLKAKDVIYIYKSNKKYKWLADKFSVSISCICDIKKGRNWGWLTSKMNYAPNPQPKKTYNNGLVNIKMKQKK